MPFTWQYLAGFIPIFLLLYCCYGACVTLGGVSTRVHDPIKQHRY